MTFSNNTAWIRKFTSYPFLSSTIMKSIANHIYVSGGNFNADSVSEGDIIYCDGYDLFAFIVAEKFIKKKYILITFLGASTMPGMYLSLLNSARLFRWFTTNLESFADERIIGIPLGMNDLDWYQYRKTDLQISQNIKDAALNLKRFSQRKINLYVNFATYTTPFRKVILQLLQRHAACGVLDAYFERSKSHKEYMMRMGESKFVISPPGRGMDCFRTWEALAAGAIPIVLSSDLNHLYKNLPILIVQDWTQLTNLFLDNYIHKIFQSDTFSFR